VVRLSYDEVEDRLTEEPFWRLLDIAQRSMRRRLAAGAISIEFPEVRVRLLDGRVTLRRLPPLQSRDLVREAMLLTGEAVARYALEHALPLPFTIQAPPAEVLPELATLSKMVAQRRAMQPSQQRTAAGRHAGLGLEVYVQATSPLRRYLDLVVHQQLRAAAAGAAIMDSAAILERIGAAEAVSGSVRWAERRSNEHWTLVHLLRHPAWQGEGIVVERRGNYDVFLIPELGLETQILRRRGGALDSRATLALRGVRLADLEADFAVVE
jgi:exoribonuclease-2